MNSVRSKKMGTKGEEGERWQQYSTVLSPVFVEYDIKFVRLYFLPDEWNLMMIYDRNLLIIIFVMSAFAVILIFPTRYFGIESNDIKLKNKFPTTWPIIFEDWKHSTLLAFTGCFIQVLGFFKPKNHAIFNL